MRIGGRRPSNVREKKTNMEMTVWVSGSPSTLNVSICGLGIYCDMLDSLVSWVIAETTECICYFVYILQRCEMDMDGFSVLSGVGSAQLELVLPSSHCDNC